MEEQEHRRYKWLRLLYKIQENKSPAVSKIKIATKKWDVVKQQSGITVKI